MTPTVRRVYNPLSRLNTAGIVTACLSPCLLNVEAIRGESWAERHILVVLGFGLGLLLTALRRGVTVEPDALVVSFGLWPIVVTRRRVVSRFAHVEVDAAWSKGGTIFYVDLHWVGADERPGRIRLLNGGYDYMEEAGRLAKRLSIPVVRTPGFETYGGEEARKLLAQFADSSEPAEPAARPATR